MEKSKLCSKKLSLCRETLRRLTAPELESVEGGIRVASVGGATCQTSIQVSCQVGPVD
jgi:hypothetical protein